MGQPVVHWELWSENPEKISDFYRQAFGWEIQHIPELTTAWCRPAVREASTAGS